jgi:hypothetical protein
MTNRTVTRTGAYICGLTLATLALLLAPIGAQAQSSCSGNNLRLEEISVPNFDAVFLSNFNLVSLTSASPLFVLQLSESQGGTDVRMTFELIAEAFEAGGPIIEAVTNPFRLTGTRQISSNDFAGRSDITGNVNFNTDAAQQLQEAILSTGRLPTGKYILRVRVENVADPNDNCQWEKTYDITNPTTLDLISPGRVAGSGDCPLIYTTLPLFQWESNAKKFIFRIAEKRPENTSPEDVMNNESRVPEDTLVAGRDFFGKPSYQYPSSGVFPLEEGKTYYWQVIAFVGTPSGDVPLESPIWCLTIGQVSGGNVSAEQIQILNYLRALLGDAAVDQMFGDGGELFGYIATGVIQRDGTSITVPDLGALVGLVQSGQLKVEDVTVE